MTNYIEIKLNEYNQSFYKHIADISTKNKDNLQILFQVLYAKTETYYICPFNIKYFGYRNSGWSLYSVVLGEREVVKNFHFPRDKLKILIRIPKHIDTIKNTHNAKKIVPYLQIPHDLHNVIYSYF